MKNKIAIIIGPILLLIIWWIASLFVEPLFIADPLSTFNAFVSLLGGGTLISDIVITLFRTLSGFVIAAALAIPLGLLLGSINFLKHSFEFVIDFFRSIPATAIFPIFLLFFGIGDAAKIAIAAFASFWIILINTISGVTHAPKMRTKVAKSMGATPLQIFRHVTLMEALPHIVSGMRNAISITLIIVVVIEMFIGTNVGLGQRLYYSYLTYQTPELYATLLTIGIVGYLVNKLFIIIEHRFIHWTGK